MFTYIYKEILLFTSVHKVTLSLIQKRQYVFRLHAVEYNLFTGHPVDAVSCTKLEGWVAGQNTLNA